MSSSYLLTFLLPHSTPCEAVLSHFANHRHVTGSAVGEENVSLCFLLLEVEGNIAWRCPELRLSAICVRNSQSQTKEIGKVFPLSVLQILKIAIKHLDKISRWWQGKRMISHRRCWILWTLLMAWTLLSPGTVWSWVSFLEELHSLASWQQSQINLDKGENRKAGTSMLYKV